MVSNMFYFHPYLGKWSILTSIFFKEVGSTTNQKTIWSKGCEPVFWQGPIFFQISRICRSFLPLCITFGSQSFDGKDFMTTLPSTNIAPENRPSQKEYVVSKTTIFQGRAIMLLSGRTHPPVSDHLLLTSMTKMMDLSLFFFLATKITSHPTIPVPHETSGQRCEKRRPVARSKPWRIWLLSRRNVSMRCFLGAERFAGGKGVSPVE